MNFFLHAEACLELPQPGDEQAETLPEPLQAHPRQAMNKGNLPTPKAGLRLRGCGRILGKGRTQPQRLEQFRAAASTGRDRVAGLLGGVLGRGEELANSRRHCPRLRSQSVCRVGKSFSPRLAHLHDTKPLGSESPRGEELNPPHAFALWAHPIP